MQNFIIMMLKKTKNYRCLKSHHDNDIKRYFKNNLTVVAVDGGKGKYITAPVYAGEFSDMFTVINGLDVTENIVLVDIEIVSTNWKADGSSKDYGVVNTIFAKAVSEPIAVKNKQLTDTSWSGSSTSYLLNGQHEVNCSSYSVISQIIDKIPSDTTLSSDITF